MSTLKQNAMALYGLHGVNYIVPLLVVPYLVRVLGPENYGRVAFAQAFIQYFVALTNYGFDLTATRTIAQAVGKGEDLSPTCNAVLCVKLTIMLLGFGLMSAISWGVPSMRAQYPLLAVCYLAVLGEALFPVWLYQGLQRMAYISIFSIAARVITLAAIFLTVKHSGQYLMAAAWLAAAFPIAGLGGLVTGIRVARIRLSPPRLHEMKRLLTESWHVFVAGLGGMAYHGNTFFLGLAASPAVVGYYAAADKLIKALQGLIHPISRAAFPHVTALLQRSDDEALACLTKLLRLFAGIGVVLGAALLLGAEWITEVLFGPQYMPTAALLRLLSPWPLLTALNVIFGALFLVPWHCDRLLSLSILVPALIHLALLFPAAVLGSAKGVAVLMVGTEAMVLLIRLIGLSQSPHRHSAARLVGG